MAGFKQRKTPYGFYNHGGLHFDPRAWQMWQDVVNPRPQMVNGILINRASATPEMKAYELAKIAERDRLSKLAAYRNKLMNSGMQTPMTKALVPYNPPGGLVPSNRFPVPLTGGPVGPYTGGGGPLAPYGGGGGPLGGGGVVPPKGPPLALPPGPASPASPFSKIPNPALTLPLVGWGVESVTDPYGGLVETFGDVAQGALTGMGAVAMSPLKTNPYAYLAAAVGGGTAALFFGKESDDGSGQIVYPEGTLQHQASEILNTAKKKNLLAKGWDTGLDPATITQIEAQAISLLADGLAAGRSTDPVDVSNVVSQFSVLVKQGSDPYQAADYVAGMFAIPRGAYMKLEAERTGADAYLVEIQKQDFNQKTGTSYMRAGKDEDGLDFMLGQKENGDIALFRPTISTLPDGSTEESYKYDGIITLGSEREDLYADLNLEANIANMQNATDLHKANQRLYSDMTSLAVGKQIADANLANDVAEFAASHSLDIVKHMDNYQIARGTLDENIRSNIAVEAEDKRQFDATHNLNENIFEQDKKEFGLTFAENRRQFDTSHLEGKRQFDTTFAEDVRQFDLGFGEGQLQFDINDRRRLQQMQEEARVADAEIAAELSRARADTSDRMREILANPADYLARSYAQRGEVSPFGEVTQADLYNQAMGEYNQYAAYLNSLGRGFQADLAAEAAAIQQRRAAAADTGFQDPKGIISISSADADGNVTVTLVDGTVQTRNATGDILTDSSTVAAAPPVNVSTLTAANLPSAGPTQQSPTQQSPTQQGPTQAELDALALAEQVGAYGENLGDFGFGSSLAGSVYSGLSPADQSAADNLLAIQAEQQRLQQQAIQAVDNYNTMVGQVMFGAPQIPVPARGGQSQLALDPTISFTGGSTNLTPAALPAALPPAAPDGYIAPDVEDIDYLSNAPLAPNYQLPLSTAAQAGAQLSSALSGGAGGGSRGLWGGGNITRDENFEGKNLIGDFLSPVTTPIKDFASGFAGGYERGGVAQGFGNPIVVGDSSNNQENQELVMSFGNAPMVVLPLNERQEDIMEQAANVGPPRAQTGGMFGNANFSTLAQMPSTTSFGGTQFGFGMDRPISQRELIQRSEMYSSPAVRDIFAGQTPQSMRFGFNLFTPGQMQSLTAGEREELRTRLAARNTTLEDVEQQVMRQFGPTGVRRGRRRF